MTEAIPSITITPAAQDYFRVQGGKFSGPSAPSAAPRIDDASFADVIDTLNPLQHLPIIGYAYRAITGDDASAGAKVAGGAAYGALLGGPVGGLISMASAIFGELFGVDDALSEKSVAVADNKPASNNTPLL
jgi:hypothetical protein